MPTLVGVLQRAARAVQGPTSCGRAGVGHERVEEKRSGTTDHNFVATELLSNALRLMVQRHERVLNGWQQALQAPSTTLCGQTTERVYVLV